MTGKRVYRVRSVHSHLGKETTRTRHFFSKTNAKRSYNRLTKAIAEVKEKGYAYSIPPDWGKPVSVQFSESEPLIFMDDEEGLF